MPKILFKTKDPLGNEIKLLQETFDKHIIIRHPEMKNKILNIKQTIECPLYIGTGTKEKNSLIFLGKLTNFNTPYIIVAVRKIKKFNKIILTAFGAKNLGLNKLNKILWPTKKTKDYTIPILPPPKK